MRWAVEARQDACKDIVPGLLLQLILCGQIARGEILKARYRQITVSFRTSNGAVVTISRQCGGLPRRTSFATHLFY